MFLISRAQIAKKWARFCHVTCFTVDHPDIQLIDSAVVCIGGCLAAPERSEAFGRTIELFIDIRGSQFLKGLLISAIPRLKQFGNFVSRQRDHTGRRSGQAHEASRHHTTVIVSSIGGRIAILQLPTVLVPRDVPPPSDSFRLPFSISVVRAVRATPARKGRPFPYKSVKTSQGEET